MSKQWVPPTPVSAGPSSHQEHSVTVEIIERPGFGPTGRPGPKDLPAGWVEVPDAQAEQRAAVAAAYAKVKGQQK
jgi:hypothetical protein